MIWACFNKFNSMWNRERETVSRNHQKPKTPMMFMPIGVCKLLTTTVHQTIYSKNHTIKINWVLCGCAVIHSFCTWSLSLHNSICLYTSFRENSRFNTAVFSLSSRAEMQNPQMILRCKWHGNVRRNPVLCHAASLTQTCYHLWPASLLQRPPEVVLGRTISLSGQESVFWSFAVKPSVKV